MIKRLRKDQQTKKYAGRNKGEDAHTGSLVQKMGCKTPARKAPTVQQLTFNEVAHKNPVLLQEMEVLSAQSKEYAARKEAVLVISCLHFTREQNT